ncbi:hypothetical protein Dalu01_03202 [Deinococcus aluminii]|uniref:Uncharacterized protein n=1 Tax=Deinococcus aluminii TaxID=1656885 RepID=A0ABP9XJB7_9DEIO
MTQPTPVPASVLATPHDTHLAHCVTLAERACQVLALTQTSRSIWRQSRRVLSRISLSAATPPSCASSPCYPATRPSSTQQGNPFEPSRNLTALSANAPPVPCNPDQAAAPGLIVPRCAAGPPRLHQAKRSSPSTPRRHVPLAHAPRQNRGRYFTRAAATPGRGVTAKFQCQENLSVTLLGRFRLLGCQHFSEGALACRSRSRSAGLPPDGGHPSGPPISSRQLGLALRKLLGSLDVSPTSTFATIGAPTWPGWRPCCSCSAAWVLLAPPKPLTASLGVRGPPVLGKL